MDGDRKDEKVLVHNDEFLMGPCSIALSCVASRGKWNRCTEECGT